MCALVRAHSDVRITIVVNVVTARRERKAERVDIV